jgi:hypothetical protein
LQASVSEHYLVSASGTHNASAAGPFLTIDGSARVTSKPEVIGSSVAVITDKRMEPRMARI